MNKSTFASYKFKPSDVIEGLNRYFAESKAFRYRRAPLEIRRGVCYNNPDCVKDIIFTNSPPDPQTRSGHVCWKCYLICDPEEVVGAAINWLREEHNIFYTPGMKIEDASRPDDTNDIFDNPRYRFLSMLSAELGFRTIVGPGNAEKTEDDILRVVKRRNELAKDADDNRREFLRNLRCELGVSMPAVNGCIEKMEHDILERIGELKEGNWPCENGVTFAAYMRKQFPKECEKWNVVPLESGSVHDWVQYIFGVLDEWRKRALKAEEDRAKFKCILNMRYGISCGYDVLPCYRDTCNNPKATRERDAANDALAELRAKIREVYRGVFIYSFEEGYSYTSALNDILEDYKLQKHIKEKADERADSYKTELSKCREYILRIYREIFDCSNGDPEGTDEETLQDILTEYKRTLELKNVAEEKTIKYKELARENEEKAAKYKVRLDNAERQLRWTEEVRGERLEKYEKLTNDLREALGIVDEYVDILGTIRKLREERNELKEKYERLYISYEKTYRAKITTLSEERDHYKRLYEKLKKANGPRG